MLLSLPLLYNSLNLCHFVTEIVLKKAQKQRILFERKEERLIYILPVKLKSFCTVIEGVAQIC